MRRAPWRSHFDELLVIYVGPQAAEALGAMQSAKGHRVVCHATAAALLRHLRTLHFAPDALVVHCETPCAHPLLPDRARRFVYPRARAPRLTRPPRERR